ncbi:hypothetical protein KI387_015274, partial [Taxus chinensis]
PGDVAMGKDIGKDAKVGIGGFVDMIDIRVVGIDRDVGIFGKFGDMGDVVTDGVDIIGNATNKRVLSGVEIGGTGCFINASRGKNDMFYNGVAVVGGVVNVHVVEMGLVGMVIEMSDVGVVIGVFYVNVGEGINVRYVEMCVDINGDEISVKAEFDV